MPGATENKDRVNRNVKELSEKLLLGWTLLSQSCPDPGCNVPLVQNKEKEKFCINCNKFIGTTAAPVAAVAKAAPAPAPAPAPLPSFATSTPTAGRSDVLRQTAISTPESLYGKPRVASPDVSRIDGEEPPEYDTQPAKTSTPPIGTGARTYAMTDAEWKPPTEEEERSIEARRKRSDQDSSEIAQKLLQGWTLLNEHCPNPECSVPLVGNKQKEMFCVSCKNWVVREKDVDKSKLRDVRENGADKTDAASFRQVSPRSAPPAPTPAAPSVRSPAAPTPVAAPPVPAPAPLAPAPASFTMPETRFNATPRTAAAQAGMYNGSAFAPAPVAVPEPAPAAATPAPTYAQAPRDSTGTRTAGSTAPSAALRSASADVDREASKAALSRTVWEKLEAARQAMAATSRVEEIRALAALMSELMAVLRNVESL